MDSRSPKHLLGVMVVLVAVAALASPAHATLPGQNGKIAFAHNGSPTDPKGYTRNVFTVNQDATGLQNFTNLFANSFEPVWSPDGQQLVFRSDYEPTLGVGADNSYNLFAIGVEGGVTQLTDVESGSDPTWSPRGEAVAYTADQHVYRVNSDGTDPRALAAGRALDWSPDGSRVAFGGIDGGVYTMRPDGSDQRLLTHTSAMSAQWSPDGSKLAFDAIRPGPQELPYGSFSVGVIDADGTDERIVSQAPDGALWPDWSPDGRRITYGGATGGNIDIYVVNADGSGGARLSHEPDFQRAPVWSPDGRMIAFLGGGVVDGVTVMNADGTGRRFLTEGHGELSWQSIPDQWRCKEIWKRGRELASCIRRAHRGR